MVCCDRALLEWGEKVQRKPLLPALLVQNDAVSPNLKLDRNLYERAQRQKRKAMMIEKVV
ncbi:MAG: hypothetical protein ACSLEL_00690 [Candidatus Malihini olakiniferum]